MKLHSTFTITLLVLVVFSTSNSSFAQESGGDKTRFTDLQLQLGFQNHPVISGDFSDFRKLMPASAVLDTFSGANYSFGSSSGSVNANFNLLASLHLKNWKKGELRFGVSSFSNQTFSSYYSKSYSYRSDTLTSSATGQQTFIDTTVNYGLNMSQQVDFIRLEVAAIFRTSEFKRLQFYTGVGISTSIGYRATATLNYSRGVSSGNFSGQNYGPGDYSNKPTERITEKNSNKVNFIHGLYIPLGAELKLHKLEEEPKHKFSIYSEFRPSIAYLVVPEIASTFNVAFQGSFGLRYRF